MPHLQMEFCLIWIEIKFHLQMGYYQTPICKWGKHPITVMGVAELWFITVCLPKFLYVKSANFEISFVQSANFEKRNI